MAGLCKYFIFLSVIYTGDVCFSQGSSSTPETAVTIKSFGSVPAASRDTNIRFLYKNQNTSLGHKWLRGELFIGGVEFGCMSVLTLMPSSFTHWQPGYMSEAMKHVKRAFTTPPVWDHDPFVINYISHPYSGALYYNVLRSQGATKWQSFIYSAAQSTFWEYVVEAVAERPSIQDLIVTPVFGALTGELINRATIRMRRNGFSFIEKVIVLIINPLYVMNNGYRSH